MAAAGAVDDTSGSADMEQATPTTLRTCTKCAKTLPLSYYYKDPRASGGYRADCKPCRRASSRRYEAANRERVRAYQAEYRAAHRAEARARTTAWREVNPEWHHRALVEYRAKPENKQKARERARDFRLANPERRSLYSKNRRARLKSVSIGVVTLELLEAKAAYWGHACWLCGENPTTWDHVKPLNKGGAHMLANLRPACWSCNSSKSDRWPFPTRPGRKFNASASERG